MSRLYPRYRDSGVEWLRDVPEHWEVKRISAAARHGEDSFTDGDWVELPHITDSGVRLIQTGNIGVGMYQEQGYRYIGESSFDELGCTQVDPGDVLICRLAYPVGRACLAPDLGVQMITSVDVCILKTSARFSAEYLVFLFSSKRCLGHVESLVRGGTRDRISRSMLGAIKIPSPPALEQIAIAAFLDRETEHIDALVEKKRRLIERLNEYRTALITRTVTRGLPPEAARFAGLDPSPGLKPSGVEWLGDVPDHWEIKRLDSRYEIKLGKMLHEARITGAYLVPYLRNIDVQWDRINLDNLPLMDVRPSETDRYTVHVGDVLVCEGGEPGRAAIVPENISGRIAFQKALHRLRPRVGEHARFLFYTLHFAAKRGAFLAGANPNTILHLTGEMLCRYRFPRPPFAEQLKIAAFLDRETEQIDALRGKAETAIDRLQEYRTALITAAVTGKIDVREAAREPVAATT